MNYLCVDFLIVFLATTLQILAPLPIGFAVFLVHLATIPITGTGINPARSLGAAIIYNKDHAWDDHVSIFLHAPFFLVVDMSEIDSNFSLLAVDLLGWTLHWSCSCCNLPPDSHQGYSFQDQSLKRLIIIFGSCIVSSTCSLFLPHFFVVSLNSFYSYIYILCYGVN